MLIGGTPIGEQIGLLRVVNTLLGAAFVMVYVSRVRLRSDRTDRLILGAFLLFAVAAVASPFPRQALDALLAMLAYVAIFYVARNVVGDPSVSRVVVWTMRGLSAAITVYSAAQYLPTYVDWWRLTDGSVVPPLGLPMVARPWGHAYDLATLGVMLLPSWLWGGASRWRVAALVTLGSLQAAVVFLLGGRSLWLGIGVASAALLAPRVGSWIRSLKPRSRLATAAALLGAVVLFIGLGGPILDRLLTSATVGQRVAMWAAATEAWEQRPFTGFGPGSFPWVLQETNYFDTNSVHARHPDSALFQLLAEGGVVGVAAAATVLVAVAWPLVRWRATLALWPILVFLADGAGGNPTDFSYLIIVAAVWAAFGLPRQPTGAVNARSRPLVRPVLNVGFGLMAVPIGAMLMAGLWFDAAAGNVHRDDLDGALNDFDLAVMLDPGMALYVRQRGIASLLSGDPAAASEDLRKATALNPNDDLSWRALAIALRVYGEETAARNALERAIDLQRSDRSSLILLAAWQKGAGDSESLRDTVSEIALAWPTVLAAPGWADIAGDISSREAVRLALERWEQGIPSPEPIRGQLMFLSVLAERSDLFDEAAGLAANSAPLEEATVAVGWCEPEAAALLASLPSAERRSSTYWELRVRNAAELGTADPDALRLYELSTFTTPSSASAQLPMNPLRENNARGSVDAWGYDRVVVRWDSSPVELPLPDAGADLWLLDPAAAREAVGFTSGPGDCSLDR